VPQNAWYWQKSCNHEKNCSYKYRPTGKATTGGLQRPR